MKWCLIAASCVLFATGCTTDNEPGNPAPLDAGLASDTAIHDASPERLTVDGFIDIFDAFPIPDGPAAACINCVRLACALTSCIAMQAEGGPGGAGPDPACLFGCFMGNLGALASATGAFTCIGMNCTAACAAGDAGD
jgi:hypothetical protein